MEYGSIALNHKAGLLAIGHSTGIDIFSYPRLEPLNSYRVNSAWVSSLCISPNGKYLVAEHGIGMTSLTMIEVKSFRDLLLHNTIDLSKSKGLLSGLSLGSFSSDGKLLAISTGQSVQVVSIQD